MRTYSPLPSYAEFKATCAERDVRIDDRIDGQIPSRGPMYAPHSILAAIMQAGDILKDEPGRPLYEGEGRLGVDQFEHRATKALAGLIGGPLGAESSLGPNSCALPSTKGYPGICRIAERSFARTILSWDGTGWDTSGDLVVDDRGEAIFLRKHYGYGEKTTLVLGENVYSNNVWCPPGMITSLVTAQEEADHDFIHTNGRFLRILPLRRFTQDSEPYFSIGRMSLFGLSPRERAEIIANAPGSERHQQPELNFYEQRLILSGELTRIRYLAQDAISRVVSGGIAGNDLR